MMFRDPSGRVFYASPQSMRALQRSLAAGGGTGCTSWRNGTTNDSTARAVQINNDSGMGPGRTKEWINGTLYQFTKGGGNTTVEICNSPEDTPPVAPGSCGAGEVLDTTTNPPKCVPAPPAKPPALAVSSSAAPLILGAVAVVAAIAAAVYFSGRGPAVVVASGARGARGARGPAARRRVTRRRRR